MSNDTPENTPENNKGRAAREAVEAALRELEDVCSEHGLTLGVALLAPSVGNQKPLIWYGTGVSLEHALGLTQAATLRIMEKVRAREQTDAK